MYLRLALSPQSSCLHLLSAGIIGEYQQVTLKGMFLKHYVSELWSLYYVPRINIIVSIKHSILHFMIRKKLKVRKN